MANARRLIPGDLAKYAGQDHHPDVDDIATLSTQPGSIDIEGKNVSAGKMYATDVALVLAITKSDLGMEAYVLTTRGKLGWCMRDYLTKVMQ